MTKQDDETDTSAKLGRYFGDTFSVAERVLETIESEPARLWRAEELLDATGMGSMMELLMIVARLTSVEMIIHPDVGGYCAVDGAATGRSLRSA